MTMTAQAARSAALDDLSFFWGDIYDFALIRAKWAARTDDGSRTLTASSSEELRALVKADYQAHPVPRRDTHEGRAAMDQAQAQALKELDVHWGEFYIITLTSHGWMARRRDNGHFLVAATPDDLEELMETDCQAGPVRLGAAAEEPVMPPATILDPITVSCVRCTRDFVTDRASGAAKDKLCPDCAVPGWEG